MSVIETRYVLGAAEEEDLENDGDDDDCRCSTLCVPVYEVAGLNPPFVTVAEFIFVSGLYLNSLWSRQAYNKHTNGKALGRI